MPRSTCLRPGWQRHYYNFNLGDKRARCVGGVGVAPPSCNRRCSSVCGSGNSMTRSSKGSRRRNQTSRKRRRNVTVVPVGVVTVGIGQIVCPPLVLR